jgi:DNA (cytosine-5)-methyltransferase 1
MKYLSVCSGVEAATVAWHDLGWKPIAFSEIEPFPSAVLAHRFPNVPNVGDMTKYKEWNLNDSIDLLVGGTPCQSFSVAGLRKGLEDPRGNLMLTYVGILDKFRPKWCVWENVPGVLSSNGGRDFGSFLGALVELGYGFAYRVLDAQHFGVPQRRRRVFVVGCLGDWVSPAKVLFESESLLGNFKTGRGKKQDSSATSTSSTEINGGADRIAHAISTKTRHDPTTNTLIPCPPDGKDTIGTLMARDYKGFGNQDMKDGRGLIVYENHPTDSRVREMGSVCTTVTARWGTGGGNVPFALAENTIGRQPMNGGNGNGFTEGGPMYTLNATGVHGVAYGFEPGIAKRDGNPNRFVEDKTPTLRANMGDNQTATAYAVDVYNQAVDGDVAATLTSACGGTNTSGPKLMQNMAVRRLTPIECERLQGFPDNHTNIPWRKKEESPDGPRYKAMGNSMAVPVMHWLGQRITMVENEAV